MCKVMEWHYVVGFGDLGYDQLEGFVLLGGEGGTVG